MSRRKRRIQAWLTSAVYLSDVAPNAFVMDTDASTIATAISASAVRGLWIDRAVKKLKNTGLWAKMRWFMPHGDTAAHSIINWKNTAESGTVVGSPTFVANVGYTGVANTGYVNTGLNISTLNQNNLAVNVWAQSTTTSSNVSVGASNAGSEGITIATRRATDNNIGLRLAGAFDQVSPVGDGDGFGLSGGSRTDASTVIGMRNGVQKTTVARASAALPSLNLYYMTNNGNGTPSTTSGVQLAGLFVSDALTATEHKNLTAIVGEYLQAIRFGEFDFETVGVGSATITADVAAVGFTMSSIMYLLQAGREGKTGVLIGGWRDRIGNLAGTSSGGLGFVDFDNLASLGGLPRYAITRMNAIQGTADTTFKFKSGVAQKVAQELLDPAKNGGITIPVYETNGVATVLKTGAAITSLTTTDGRLVTASQFFDGTYEGDLLRRAGVGYTIGREAASGSGLDTNNGVKLSTTDLGFDPWNTADTPASGLIPNVTGIRSTFSPELDTVGADGTGDSHVQSYNFRLTATNVVTRRVPFPSTPPPGYDEANYEFLLRWLALNPTVDTFGEIFKEDVLYDNTFDVNNENFVSLDYVGFADDYALASYSAREVIWKATWNYILGFLYTIQYSSNPRVPAALKTSMESWGFLQDHYYAPHELDAIGQNPQMYVRESIRMVGASVLLGNDLDETDASAIRISDKTISTISYQTDSHAAKRVAYEGSAGVWTTRNEGGFGVVTGGVDETTPVPFEVVVPKVAECSNLAVGFCISSNHVAFGAYRMEMTMWQVGQSMGLAAALAIDGDNVIQNVDYPTLRTALLATGGTLVGEVDPVLPQVN